MTAYIIRRLAYAIPILIGVNADRLAFDSSGLNRLLADGPIRSDLSYAHWGGPRYSLNHPEVLLASFLAGPRGLQAMVAGAPIYHDDRPVLDYETLAPSRSNSSVAFEIFPLLREYLDPVEEWLDLQPVAGPLDPATIAEIRQKNLADVGAYLKVREAVREVSRLPVTEIEEIVREALRQNP